MKMFKYIIIIGISAFTALLIGVYLYRPYLLFSIPINKINCIDYTKTDHSSKLNDKTSFYMHKVKLNGIVPCSNEHELVSNNLLFVDETKNYVVASLTSSYPYLTKKGKSLLDSIGARFNSKLINTPFKGTKFIVSSLTRTTESVNRLMKWNKNAVQNSPHLYGETFDIKYKMFHRPFAFLSKCNKKYLESVLAEVLYEMRTEKKCWVLKEKRQPCFHVVARN